MQKNRILLLEDDDNIAILIKDTLERENFFVSISTTIKEARQKMSKSSYDLMILDRKLSDGDGIDFCREIRSCIKTKDIPIIFLTAMDLISDKITGLKVGGDDYLTKPFDYEELLARVEAIFRRSNKKNDKKNHILEVFGIILDKESHECKINNQNIDLWPKEFELLKIFMENPTKVLSKDILAENIWNMDYMNSSRTIEMTIQRLRKKLNEKSYLIKTVKGYGFKFQD
jgi:DNA-binding response OmpR family regulator